MSQPQLQVPVRVIGSPWRLDRDIDRARARELVREIKLIHEYHDMLQCASLSLRYICIHYRGVYALP